MRVYACVLILMLFLLVAAVSYDALRLQVTRAQNTIFNAKRFLGGSFDDPAIVSYANSHPFSVVATNASNFTKVGFQLSKKAINVYTFVYYTNMLLLFTKLTRCVDDYYMFILF